MYQNLKRQVQDANLIRTTKYTWYSFIPCNLWEQFRRRANIWFLLVSLLQIAPLVVTIMPESPMPWSSTVMPWMLVLFVTMMKDLSEHVMRLRHDKRTNGQLCYVLDPAAQRVVPTVWAQVQVRLRKERYRSSSRGSGPVSRGSCPVSRGSCPVSRGSSAQSGEVLDRICKSCRHDEDHDDGLMCGNQLFAHLAPCCTIYLLRSRIRRP